LPSDILAAFLYAQLENLDDIQNKRKQIWDYYYEQLAPLASINLATLPYLPPYATNNAHMFYLVCKDLQERTDLIEYLNQKGVKAIFHYLSLHKSTYFQHKYTGADLAHSDRYSDCLVRLPFYYELTTENMELITSTVNTFFLKKNAYSFYR
jgi:dTDP-4-amino-4,6-dideoxygalactose transaminase